MKIAVSVRTRYYLPHPIWHGELHFLFKPFFLLKVMFEQKKIFSLTLFWSVGIIFSSEETLWISRMSQWTGSVVFNIFQENSSTIVPRYKHPLWAVLHCNGRDKDFSNGPQIYYYVKSAFLMMFNNLGLIISENSIAVINISSLTLLQIS